MKKSFLILAATDLLLLGIDGGGRLRVRGPDDFLKHSCWGCWQRSSRWCTRWSIRALPLFARCGVAQQRLEQGTGTRRWPAAQRAGRRGPGTSAASSG
ncbi:MAG: hypothetical protein U1A27_06990 [Phycisphaerae bacterium]